MHIGTNPTFQRGFERAVSKVTLASYRTPGGRFAPRSWLSLFDPNPAPISVPESSSRVETDKFRYPPSPPTPEKGAYRPTAQAAGYKFMAPPFSKH